jgi:hypothetical protein
VVQPAELGGIGKDHLFAMLEKAGGNSKTFTYQKRLNTTGGLPWVVEVASVLTSVACVVADRAAKK